jgi:hypothetical protein
MAAWLPGPAVRDDGRPLSFLASPAATPAPRLRMRVEWQQFRNEWLIA